MPRLTSYDYAYRKKPELDRNATFRANLKAGVQAKMEGDLERSLIHLKRLVRGS